VGRGRKTAYPAVKTGRIKDVITPSFWRETVSEALRLRTVLLTIALSIGTVILVAGRSWSDGRTAALLAGVNTGVFLLHIVRQRDAAFARLLLFGLVFGIVELIADALCVRFTGTLDYSPARSAMIWESPWWMPMAWMIVAAQIGYIGSRLIQRFGMVKGALLTALLGAVNIPFYEEMAFHAHWWQYRDCWMIGHTPLYIIAAELLIGLALGPLACRTLQTPSYRIAIFCGVLGGVSTIIGGLIGYGTVEIIVPLLFALRFAM
jgi:hypothetical protein